MIKRCQSSKNLLKDPQSHDTRLIPSFNCGIETLAFTFLIIDSGPLLSFLQESIFARYVVKHEKFHRNFLAGIIGSEHDSYALNFVRIDIRCLNEKL
jgi:hypothetical protein